jgi:dipeptidyl aminopeptidase/acylaminoacyl peptidase
VVARRFSPFGPVTLGGENDKRVPIPNAYGLRQGLEDRGTKVEMIVYKGYATV